MQFAYLRDSRTYSSIPADARSEFRRQVEASRDGAFESGGGTRLYEVAGRKLCVRYADDRVFERMSRAIAHLETSLEPSIDLTVYAWDAQRSFFPALPWQATDVSYRGDVQLQGINTEGCFVAHRLGEKILTLFDKNARTAYVWTEDIQTVPNWAMGAPLRTLFHLWLTDEGLQMVHGAVVGLDGTGVLLTARGGSGKSTTAVLCLQNGMLYVGDDYIAVAFDEARPVAHSLYNTGKLHRHVAAAFPDFATAPVDASESNDDKQIFYINEGAFADRLENRLPLGAVMVPIIVDKAETIVRPIHGAIALAALAPTTMTQLPYCGEKSLRNLRQLVERVPCFALELGRRPSGVLDAIRSHLDGLRSS